MRPFRAVLAVFSAASLLSVMSVMGPVGCGGDPCEKLSEALCDGGEQAYCEQVDAWLATRLVDPQTSEPLAGEPRAQMCGTIYKSVDIFNAYRFKAKQKILGVPDFTLASSTPPENKADPSPKTEPKSTAPATPPVTPEVPEAEDKEVKDEERPAGQNMSD